MNLVNRRRSSLAHFLDRLQPSAWVVLGGAAILVGVLGGAGVWLFQTLFHWATHLFTLLSQLLAPYGLWTHALVTAGGGLLVGLILHFLVGAERHHGVAGIIESVALGGGQLRYWRIPAKTLAAAVSIGCGASVGPEDPSVQIGANLGSMFGQWFHLSDERVRVLVASGAAAGVAAAFNAPIAGVFFALEIILGEISGAALGAVLLAAVVSAAFTQAVSGPQPAFTVPIYPYHSALELPLYLGLGVLLGPVAALYVNLIHRAHDVFHAWHAPQWIKPALAGLLVGSAGIFLPQIQGVGYDTVGSLLNNALPAASMLIALGVAKLIFTPVSVGGGFPGGVFAPALFVGATLGAAYGAWADHIIVALNLEPASFAMVGMAAMLAAAIHAPLTAILLLFEMTNDYRIILPLMFSVTVSLLISQRIQRHSVYILGLARKGIHIERGRDVEVLEGITVGEVMETEFPSIAETATVAAASDMLLRRRSHGMPVVNDSGELCGVITLQDIERTQTQDDIPNLTVGDLCTRDVLVAYAEESMGTALRRMSTRDIGRLPVVMSHTPRRMVGLLRRTTVIRAYEVALARRAALRHQANQVQLGAVGGIDVYEFTIRPDAPSDGRSVSQIPWPHVSVLATVRRGSRLLIPRGDTVLQAGDVLAVVAERTALSAIETLCRATTNDEA